MPQRDQLRPDTGRVRLLATMPLLFRRERFHLWFEQIRCLAEMDVGALRVHVITSTFEPDDLALIRRTLAFFTAPNFSYEVESSWDSTDPKAMTWRHKPLVRDQFVGSGDFTHFLYLEDDLRFSIANLRYWMLYRERLASSGLLPSFIRYELREVDRDLYLSDCVNQTRYVGNVRRIAEEDFITPDNPYAAMYLLDQDLGAEYITSASFDSQTSVAVIGWPSTERSAMGLMFANPPPGRQTRVVVPLDPVRKLPLWSCFIHHMPNNFTNSKVSFGRFPFGSIRLTEGFADGETPPSDAVRY